MWSTEIYWLVVSAISTELTTGGALRCLILTTSWNVSQCGQQTLKIIGWQMKVGNQSEISPISAIVRLPIAEPGTPCEMRWEYKHQSNSWWFDKMAWRRIVQNDRTTQGIVQRWHVILHKPCQAQKYEVKKIWLTSTSGETIQQQ